MLKIVTAPNSILAQSAKQISKIDKNVLALIEEMSNVLLAAKDPEGVGLAAPQAGRSLQIFIAKPTPKSPIQIFINPKQVSSNKYPFGPSSGRGQVLSKKKVPIRNTKYKIHDTKLEGCLSLPNIWGEVIRDPYVTISYLDEKGKNHIKKFQGLSAIIVQHEIDHLNGILFPKRVLEQKGTLYKSHKDEKSEDVFEEIEL